MTKPRRAKGERRDGLRANLAEMHKRAQHQVNRRGARAGLSRQDKMTRQAAIASSTEHFEDDFLPLNFLKRLLHWGFGSIISVLCIITILTMVRVAEKGQLLTSVIYSTELLSFVVGIGLMMSWFLVKRVNDQLLYLYVFGHELTHAFFVIVCGGKVSDIQISKDGGYIMTNKSNILIALSPYFVPFWSIVMMFIYGMIALIVEIPGGSLYFMGLLGFTWTFHMAWTIWMIPKDQPDLREHGTFYSLMIITLANLMLLSLMMCFTQSHIGLLHFGFEWWNMLLNLWELLCRLLPIPSWL